MEGLFTKSINRFIASVLTAAMLFSFADVPILAYAEGDQDSGDDVYEDTATLPELPPEIDDISDDGADFDGDNTALPEFPTEPEESDETEPPEEQEEDPADIPEDDYPVMLLNEDGEEPDSHPIYVMGEDEVRQYFDTLSDAYNALSVDNVIHIIGDYTGDSETLVGGTFNNILIKAEDAGEYNITGNNLQLEGIKVHFEGFNQTFDNGLLFKVGLIEMDAQSSLYFDSGRYIFGDTANTKVMGQFENNAASEIYFFPNGGENNQSDLIDIENASVFMLCKGTSVNDLVNCNVEMSFESDNIDDASINSINNTVQGLTVSIGAGTVKFDGLTANGGEVNISGGFVTNITTENCEVTVSGGTFSNQFHSTDDNLLVTGGSYSANTVINNAGTTDCSALVKGGTFENGFSVEGEGVKVTGGTYYNKPDIADNIPAGYEWIQTSDISTGRQVWTLICHAYKVGETEYSTLADAVDACGTIDTITVLADIEDAGAQIPAGADITIDLNGCSTGSDAASVSVSDGAQLTVTDSAGGGRLDMEIVSSDTSSKLIVNSGELTKTVDFGGRVEISDGTFAGEIHASNGARISGGTFAAEIFVSNGVNISDGTFEEAVYASNEAFISGGTFNSAFTAESTNEVQNQINIIDGTFNGTVTLSSQYFAPAINDGTFNAAVGRDSGCKLPLAKGGRFKNVDGLSFEQDYIPTLEDDGYYHISMIGSKSYYANGKLYDDLQSALNDCDSGKENVIELLRDAEEESPHLGMPDVTLKLNGHTLTVERFFSISDGDITIIGDGILNENGEFEANGTIVGKLTVNGTAVLTNVKVESVDCDAGNVTLNDSWIQELYFQSGTLIVNGARLSRFNHSSIDTKPVFGDGTILINNLTVSSGAFDIDKEKIHVLYTNVGAGTVLSISKGTFESFIQNAGTLNISGGTFAGEISGAGIFDIKDGTFNSTVIVGSDGTLTVSGGTFKDFVKAGGKLTVSSGLFEDDVDSELGLEITGGTFSGLITAYSVYSVVNEITITDGIFNGNVALMSMYSVPEISGGTFNAAVGIGDPDKVYQKPEASGGRFKNIDGITAADGHVFIKNGDYYVVDSADNYPFRVNGAVYPTLDAAVEACSDEHSTIELLGNATVNDDVTVNDKQITIELNGFTLTIAANINLTVGNTSTLQINGGQEKGAVSGSIINKGTFHAESVALDTVKAEGSTSIQSSFVNTLTLSADAGLELVNSEVTILCQESSTELSLEDADNNIDTLCVKSGNVSITKGKINNIDTPESFT